MNRLDYEKQLGDVTAYIYDHLQDDLDLDRLADIACLSPFHWHRVYQALRGETVAATVKRLRMQRAAGYLAETSLPVRIVARRCGYDNLASFSRAFKEVFGAPPSTYRTSGNHMLFRAPGPNAALLHHPVEVRDIEPITLHSAAHSGSFMFIAQAFTKVFDALVVANQLTVSPRMIAIFYDDPASVPERLLRSRAGIVAIDPDSVVTGLDPVLIPGGRHAVLRYQGPYASMHAAYEWFFGHWLTHSGKTPGDHPVFEDYLNNPVDTDPRDLLTDIYMPLQARDDEGAFE